VTCGLRSASADVRFWESNGSEGWLQAGRIPASIRFSSGTVDTGGTLARALLAGAVNPPTEPEAQPSALPAWPGLRGHTRRAYRVRRGLAIRT
jgi:hypothetical protein